MTAGDWRYFSKSLPVPSDIWSRLQMTANACRRLLIFAVAFK
jgi:hypothetical protein